MSEQKQPKVVPMEVMYRQLEHAGIIAHLDLDLPLPELIQLGDAFLASPLAATVVACNHIQVEEAIVLLRRRSGGNMLVGASGIVDKDTLLRVITAGAQFIMAPIYDTQLADCAQSDDVVYVPGVFTGVEVGQAYAADNRLVHLFPSDIFGPEHAKMLTKIYPDICCIASGGISTEDVAMYAQAGACGVMVGAALVGDNSRTQAEIISQARRLLDIWEQNKVVAEKVVAE